MTNRQQEKIDEIMDWFDFARVADVMEHLDWKWVTSDGKHIEVPTESTIRQSARKMMRRLFEGNSMRRGISSGGLVATLVGREYDDINLTFELESWSTDSE